MTTMKIQVVLI